MSVVTRFVTPEILEVKLSRPKKRNAINLKMFKEIGDIFRRINDCAGAPKMEAKRSKEKHEWALIRAVILCSEGDIFTAGIDLNSFAMLGAACDARDPARSSIRMHRIIENLQDELTAVAKCCVPVIAAIHGSCIGAGVDLVATADIRIASTTSSFCVKEIDIAMAADLGTLQRLPRIVGSQSLVREWCFTGRDIPATEALSAGLVSHVVPPEELYKKTLEIATAIALKSPVGIYGSKLALNRFWNGAVQDELRQTALMNSALLQAEDLMQAATAAAAGRKGKKNKQLFAKL